MIKRIIHYIFKSLSKGRRIEIRGFGSFTLRYRKSRFCRNPKNGDLVQLKEKYIPYFKPGKQLKERINIFNKKKENNKKLF